MGWLHSVLGVNRMATWIGSLQGRRRSSGAVVLVGLLAAASAAVASNPPGYVPLSDPAIVGPGDPLDWPGVGSAVAAAAGTGGVQGILWTYNPGTGSEVFVARSVDHGVSWATPVSLGYGYLSDTGSNLAISPDNTWVACTALGSSLRLTRSTDNGASWEERAVFPFESSIFRFAVAAGTGGQWIAAWDASTGSPAVRRVHTSRSTDNGATWSEPEAFAPGYLLALATDSAGTLVILWRPIAIAGQDDYPVYARSSSDMGDSWSPTARVCRARSILFGWALAGDGLGNWMASGLADYHGIYDRIRVFSRDGGHLWGTPEIDEYPYGTWFRAAADGQGNWLLMWDAGSTLRFSRSFDHGHTWLPAQDLPFVPWLPADVFMDSGGHWSFVGNTGGTDNNVAVVRSLSEVDTDGDGLPDLAETNTGVYISAWSTGTDPENPDTDGDGVDDGAEVAQDRYPLGVNWPPQPAEHPPLSSAPPVLIGDVGSSNAMLAGDRTGRWGVAWNQGTEIMWRTTNDNGATWNATAVIPRGSFPAAKPYVAARPGGPWLLAYQSPDGIVLQRSTNRGASWGAPAVIHAPENTPCALIATGGANWLMLFFGDDGLYAKGSLNDGQTWQNAFWIGPSGVGGAVRAVSDRQGGCLVSWSGMDWQSHVRRSVDWGATWSEATVPVEGFNMRRSMATDTRGTWAMLWAYEGTDAFITRDLAETWDAPRRIRDGALWLAALTADANGNWLAAYDDDNCLKMRRSLDGGSSWLEPHAFAPFLESAGIGNSGLLNLETDGRGNWLAVWEDNQQIYSVHGSMAQYGPFGPDVPASEVPIGGQAALAVLAVFVTATASLALLGRPKRRPQVN